MGDFRKLFYMNIKQEQNEMSSLYALDKEQAEQITKWEVKNIRKKILGNESKSFNEKIWVLRDGTVGFGDDAIKAFRQHGYDITDAVMIDYKHDKAPLITKQNNHHSLGRYEDVETYEKYFIYPDYETKQKLSKEQSCAVLTMAISAQPEDKNLNIMFFDNLEFNKKALESLEQNFPQIKLTKVRLQEAPRNQGENLEFGSNTGK